MEGPKQKRSKPDHQTDRASTLDKSINDAWYTIKADHYAPWLNDKLLAHTCVVASRSFASSYGECDTTMIQKRALLTLSEMGMASEDANVKACFSLIMSFLRDNIGLKQMQWKPFHSFNVECDVGLSVEIHIGSFEREIQTKNVLSVSEGIRFFRQLVFKVKRIEGDILSVMQLKFDSLDWRALLDKLKVEKDVEVQRCKDEVALLETKIDNINSKIDALVQGMQEWSQKKKEFSTKGSFVLEALKEGVVELGEEDTKELKRLSEMMDLILKKNESEMLSKENEINEVRYAHTLLKDQVREWVIRKQKNEEQSKFLNTFSAEELKTRSIPKFQAFQAWTRTFLLHKDLFVEKMPEWTTTLFQETVILIDDATHIS